MNKQDGTKSRSDPERNRDRSSFISRSYRCLVFEPLWRLGPRTHCQGGSIPSPAKPPVGRLLLRSLSLIAMLTNDLAVIRRQAKGGRQMRFAENVRFFLQSPREFVRENILTRDESSNMGLHAVLCALFLMLITQIFAAGENLPFFVLNVIRNAISIPVSIWVSSRLIFLGLWLIQDDPDSESIGHGFVTLAYLSVVGFVMSLVVNMTFLVYAPLAVVFSIASSVYLIYMNFAALSEAYKTKWWKVFLAFLVPGLILVVMAFGLALFSVGIGTLFLM